MILYSIKLCFEIRARYIYRHNYIEIIIRLVMEELTCSRGFFFNELTELEIEYCKCVKKKPIRQDEYTIAAL